MESEWPYRAEHWEGHDEFVVTGPGWDKIGSTYSKREAEMGAMFANLAYAAGRKAAEKELEEKKAVKDALLCGTGFMKDGKRVPPEDVYLSDAEIKLKKAEKDFEELLMHANAMAFCSPSAIYLEFLDWKRARGIE